MNSQQSNSILRITADNLSRSADSLIAIVESRKQLQVAVSILAQTLEMTENVEIRKRLQKRLASIHARLEAAEKSHALPG